MKEKKGFEFLNVLTKSEIIAFLKTQFFTAPRKIDVDFFKWNLVTVKLQGEMDLHMEKGKKSTNAKNADKYGNLFNKEKDQTKRMEYLKKHSFYFEAFKKEHIEYSIIDKKREANDKKFDYLFK